MKPLRAVVVLLGIMPAAAVALPALSLAPGNEWKATDPPINILYINRPGEAVGYDYRPRGTGPDGAHVLRNAVFEGAQPERYTLEELQTALKAGITAIQRATPV